MHSNDDPPPPNFFYKKHTTPKNAEVPLLEQMQFHNFILLNELHNSETQFKNLSEFHEMHYLQIYPHKGINTVLVKTTNFYYYT